MLADSEILIIGGGAMGMAAAFELAKRGRAVRVFDQYAIGHDLGSSHGYSRIIRRAYYEHPDYVPLVDRAYTLWRELETRTRESLLTVTGIVEMGAAKSRLVQGSLLSCRLHSLPHEELNADEIMHRFPQFKIPTGFRGVWQKDAGILAVERCVLAMRQAAKDAGALLHEQEEVLSIESNRSGVAVRTRKNIYRAKTALVCAGAWAAKLLAALELPLRVTRQTMGFFHPKKREPFELGNFPLFLMELGAQNFYGFPFFGVDCVKVADHSLGAAAAPQSVNRQFDRRDEAPLRAFLEKHIPQAAGPLAFGKICLYTNTPDGDFILDRHPKHKNIFIAAGFSGHGFKFSSVIGEILADMATAQKPQQKIDRFKLSRFK